MLSRNWRYLCRRYSQAVNFRTTENAPAQHNDNQIGLFYTMDNNLCKQLFTHGGLPKSFSKQTKTFTETALMVRKPALEVIECIKASDLSKPAIRYVLYGDKGTGKSLTMVHLLHYAHAEGFLIIHVPWVSEWLRRITKHKEISNSASREGLVDLPLEAAAWLIHFKTQNHDILKNTALKTSKDYVWSKRETTPTGSSILELIDHGINRVKYASDVIDVLIKEIKLMSSSKQIKTFVSIDGFNSFFYPLTRLKTATKRYVRPDEVTLTSSFMEITNNDWTNAVIVVTADQLAVPDDHQETFYPRYLLTKKGFEHLDPFVPIEVRKYNEKEYLSCASYYRDRLWLRGPPQLETELKFTSAYNPYKFMEVCAPL